LPAMGAIRDLMREAADVEALVRRAQGGDRAAFDELVRTHFTTVYAFLIRMVGNPEDAEDLAQECFVRAHRFLAHWRGEAAFSSWLLRIALHLARDHHRSRASRRPTRRFSELADAEVSQIAERPQAAASGELARRLALAVERLPEHLHAALV